MQQVAVGAPERRESLAPLLVGRRLHLLGARSPKPLGGGVDVVRVEPEREVGIVLSPSPREADSERLELEEDEGGGARSSNENPLEKPNVEQ